MFCRCESDVAQKSFSGKLFFPDGASGNFSCISVQMSCNDILHLPSSIHVPAVSGAKSSIISNIHSSGLNFHNTAKKKKKDFFGCITYQNIQKMAKILFIYNLVDQEH